jgi:precorrin-2/cobalt-factor-2 C20-methyltransferase
MPEMTENNKGTLYAVGIGPGDPELLTLKAARLIKTHDLILVPKGKEDGESLALSIIKGAVELDGKEIREIHFPMKKGSVREVLLPEAEKLLRELKAGRSAVFVTLGDPVLYSTFFHLMDALESLDKDVTVELVPGVTSVTAAGAAAGVALALSSDKVAILPATYKGKDGMEGLRRALKEFDTVVLMKTHRVIEEVKEMLKEMDLLDKAWYIARVGLADEIVRPLSELEEKELSYFSIVIVKT